VKKHLGVLDRYSAITIGVTTILGSCSVTGLAIA
jgi:hypothetical protein